MKAVLPLLVCLSLGVTSAECRSNLPAERGIHDRTAAVAMPPGHGTGLIALDAAGPNAESSGRKGPGTGRSAEQGSSSDPGVTKKETEVLRLKKQIIELQNQGKLGFNKVVPCSSVERFGIYSPLKSGKPLSTVIFYVEPSNYGTLVTKDRYIIDCVVDLAVLNSEGKLIAGKKGLLKINRVSRSPIIDLYFKIRVKLKKPLKKDITIRTRLRDNIRNESATATYRINVQSKDRTSPRGI